MLRTKWVYLLKMFINIRLYLSLVSLQNQCFCYNLETNFNIKYTVCAKRMRCIKIICIWHRVVSSKHRRSQFSFFLSAFVYTTDRANRYFRYHVFWRLSQKAAYQRSRCLYCIFLFFYLFLFSLPVRLSILYLKLCVCCTLVRACMVSACFSRDIHL